VSPSQSIDDVIAPVTTSQSRGLDDHFRSQQPAADHSRAGRSGCWAHNDVSRDDVTSGQCEVPVFYVAVTLVASFTACLLCASVPCLVALVAITSLLSFVANSLHTQHISKTALHSSLDTARGVTSSCRHRMTSLSSTFYDP